MKRLQLMCILAVFLGAMMGRVAPATTPSPRVEVPRVNAKQLHTVLDAHAGLVIDVRSPQQFARLHIPGALNIPFEALSTCALAKGTFLVVCCT